MFQAYIASPQLLAFFTQEPNEKIVLLLRRHWFTNVGWILTALVLTITPLLSLLFLPYFSFFYLFAINYRLILISVYYLFIFAFVFENYLLWYYNVFIVTNKRILDLDFWGLFYTQSSEAELEEIQDVTFTRGGIFQLLFNYGSVYVQTAGKQRFIEMRFIPTPERAQETISHLLQNTDKHKLPDTYERSNFNNS